MILCTLPVCIKETESNTLCKKFPLIMCLYRIKPSQPFRKHWVRVGDVLKVVYFAIINNSNLYFNSFYLNLENT